MLLYKSGWWEWGILIIAFGMGYLHQSIWQSFWEYPNCFGNSRVDPELGWSNLCLSEWVKLLSRVRLFVTLWIVAHQAPPSMGFSRQEYWSGLPFPSPGDLANPGIKPGSPALQADALSSEPPGKPQEWPNQGLFYKQGAIARGHVGLKVFTTIMSVN